MIYHVGDLASDRYIAGLSRLASEWMALSDRNMVALFQRRLGGSAMFEYVAVRTVKPWTERSRIHDVVTAGARSSTS